MSLIVLESGISKIGQINEAKSVVFNEKFRVKVRSVAQKEVANEQRCCCINIRCDYYPWKLVAWEHNYMFQIGKVKFLIFKYIIKYANGKI